MMKTTPNAEPLSTEEASPSGCPTCEHARIRNNKVKCRLQHWEEVSREVFEKLYGRHSCKDWEGEPSGLDCQV